MSHPPYALRRLASGDLPCLRQLNALFAVAFDDEAVYVSAPPDDGYLESLLAKDHIVVLVATVGEAVVGGLVAYELEKLEQARRETYIYDLAVVESHRRRGIATALIGHLREIAAARDAHVIYVQADREDAPAIALYSKLGTRKEVLHFDIAVTRNGFPLLASRDPRRVVTMEMVNALRDKE